MSATCPQCHETDQAVGVPQALADADRPLDEPTRALLSPPPEPPVPITGGTSGAAIALFAVAAMMALLTVMSQLQGTDEDLSGYDSAYRFGRTVGPYIAPVVLLVAGLVVRTVGNGRRRRRAETALAVHRPLWERNVRVWQAGWFCRRCRVGFFPDASIRPDFPASPAIAVERFPLWVTTAAERAFGPEAPALPS